MVFTFRKRSEAADVTPEAPSATTAEGGADTTGVETLNTLQHFEKMHKLDPNLPIDELNEVDAVLHSGNAEKGIEIEQALLEDNSPYPEVSIA